LKDVKSKIMSPTCASTDKYGSRFNYSLKESIGAQKKQSPLITPTSMAMARKEALIKSKEMHSPKLNYVVSDRPYNKVPPASKQTLTREVTHKFAPPKQVAVNFEMKKRGASPPMSNFGVATVK